MIGKQHIHDGKLVLALIDSNLLGKQFEENGAILDFRSAFYKGVKIKHEDVESLAKKACMINAAGVETISLLISLGIVTEKSTKVIQKIPYAIVIFEG